MNAEPQREHQWLEKLVGEWQYESDCSMGPDKPREKFEGSESVRRIGGPWVVCEGQGEMPDRSAATTMMTLGYDSKKKRFVGTWVGSMMEYLWVYDGELDSNGKTLTLNTQGPDMTATDKTAKYRDVIEFKSDDHRTLTSHSLGPDGKWQEIMTAHYRRRK